MLSESACRPQQILVKPFEFYEAGVQVNRSGPQLEAFQHAMQEKMTRYLVRSFSRDVASARAVARTAPPPRGRAWLVTGRFDRIDQGSRLLRSAVGFGAGATKFETSVVIYDLSKKRRVPFLLIETTAGSNAPPGVAADTAYLFGASMSLLFADNFLEGSRAGLTFDAIRTARAISKAASRHLEKRGAQR